MPDRDHSFKAFVLDQLDFVDGLACRPMFGGFGLYAGTVFFGIIHRGRLYFKTDANTRTDYIAQGMAVFQPKAKQKLKKGLS